MTETDPGANAGEGEWTMPEAGERKRRRVVERCQGVSGELSLLKAGRSHFEIVANGVFLMATYNRRSEKALARLALDACPGTGLRVLIGGLGVGHTLAAVLAGPRVASVTVVELEPKVIEWNRAYFRASGAALADPRARVVPGDFLGFLRDLALARLQADGRPKADGFHVIVADTDNGPDWLVRPENYAIYGRRGLALACAALEPGGVASFWSSAEAPWFARGLAAASFEVEVHRIAARGVVPPDVVYLGRKPAGGHGIMSS